MNKSFIKLFATCRLVKGVVRSMIIDSQRREFHLIPNDLYSILTTETLLTEDEIIEKYGDDNRETLESYFDFLIEKQLGFRTCNPELFPEIDMNWDTPRSITNAIVDIDSMDSYDIKSAICQLDDLGCEAIQLRCYDILGYEQLSEFLEYVVDHTLQLRSLELLVKYSEEFDEKSCELLLEKNLLVSLLVLHSSPFTRRCKSATQVQFVYVKQIIDSALHCGQIFPDQFSMSINHLTESILHNSCLNRKVGIDRFGEIKNCPSMTNGYGRIGEIKIADVINEKKFNSIWNVSKVQVSICKDCEFRMVCTDCRAFVEVPSDPLSKPLKCGYDPYTGNWENWSHSPWKMAIMEKYGIKSANII